jgi:hypothetical protein
MANELLWGFHKGLRDQINLPIAQVEPRVLAEAVAASEAQYNRDFSALTGLMVGNTTEHTIRYKTIGLTRNQPIGAVGRAIPNRAGGYYDVAFPIRRSANAFGWDWEARQYLTVQDVNDRLSALFIGDVRWNRDHMLAAAFTNIDTTFVDEEYGSLTVKPIANGDTATYLITAGNENGATDNHFLFQNASIADANNPLPTIREELLEHPENGGEVILIHGSGLTDDFMGLAGFVERTDSNIEPGTSTATLRGSLNVTVPGRVYGYCDGVWLVEWAQIPANYAIAVTSAPTAPPLYRRQPKLVALQGFKQVGEREDFPWYERQFRRYAGYGAYNRVGMVVVKFGAASYTIPTNYTAPLAN